MKRFILLTAALLLLPLQAVASDISVEGAWLRLPPPVADTAAGYMTLRNNGDHAIEITGIKTAAATNPEFHSMEMNGDMMQMKKMEKVIVPAHSGISFNPNGNHLMLIGLTGQLKTGEHIMMTLTTSEDETIMVHAEVRDMRGHGSDGNMNMKGDMQMDGMKMNADMHGGHDMNGMHH